MYLYLYTDTIDFLYRLLHFLSDFFSSRYTLKKLRYIKMYFHEVTINPSNYICIMNQLFKIFPSA